MRTQSNCLGIDISCHIRCLSVSENIHMAGRYFLGPMGDINPSEMAEGDQMRLLRTQMGLSYLKLDP